MIFPRYLHPKKFLNKLLNVLLIFSMAVAQGAFAEPTQRGSLIIVGGGDTPINVQSRFVELAGGPHKAKIAVLPMASTEYDEEAQEVINDFQMLDAEVHVLNFDRTEANNVLLAARLEKFSGFWFLGGNQNRLAEILINTRALDVIERRYQEGAVVGGTSAGAAIMTKEMLTGKRHGISEPTESDGTTIARGTFELSQGFGFLPNAIVDQHFLKRARYNRLLSAVLEQPQLIGVGIDEETAVLVRPDGLWEVLGDSYVKIFDARQAQLTNDDKLTVGASGVTMHLLPAGSLYNPKKGKVTLPLR